MSAGGYMRMVFFFQAEDGIRDYKVTGVQTCALPISRRADEGMTVGPRLLAAPAALLVGLAGCKKAESAPLYEKIAVAPRDIVVTASAEGVIQPTLKFSVKSKAWGQILAMPVQTGDEVQKGQLLTKVDPRIPQNNLAQAQAALNKAQAQLANATSQLRSEEHTSELQSPCNLVCRLLLEKKKTMNKCV